MEPHEHQGKKRKDGGRVPSTKREQNKRRNLGPKKLDARRAELENQFENMGVWPQDQSSDTSEYTPERRRREEAQLEEAILGMSTTLRDYQAVGAAFMVRQERSRNACRGGILADDMGIGKTVQSIACALAHPPSKKALHAFRGATLIIVPNKGLALQWEKELLEHGKITSREVCKYGGKMGALAIRGYPYVLATYSQVERDFRLHSSQRDNEEGPLFDVEFYRIILDEGDNIRNYNGSTSKACCKLNAQLKWVLSGTPLRNNIKECRPYFRFLGIDVDENLEEFVKKWKTPQTDDQHSRTMQILANVMFRRESSQRFLGRHMCKLPETHIEDKILCLTDEEATISRHLQLAMLREEEEARERAKEAKKGANEEDIQGFEEEEPGSSAPKSNYRVRCTRLRQAVDHINLLEQCLRDILNKDEVINLIAELDKIQVSTRKVKNETPSPDGFPRPQPGEPSVYEWTVDIKAHLDDILSSHDRDGCLECFGVLELQSLGCGHTMCLSCYLTHSNDASAEKKQCKCPRCGKVIPTIKEDPDNKRVFREELVKIKSEIIRTSDGRSSHVVPNRKGSHRSPGDDYNGVQPQTSKPGCRWLEKCDEQGVIVPSTKTTAALDIIGGWEKEAPKDKIIVFTEWIATAQILGRMLNRAGINFVYYSGHISAKDRNKNLEDFKSNPEIKVMISTMATGNVGLNITVANRMIIMNPWWNSAAEAQAFGRIKRHGQTKETYLIRLFAKDTIDERILKLQKQKGLEIKDAMTEAKKPKLLSSEERYWLITDRHAPESPLIEPDAALSGSETERAEDDSEGEGSD